MIVHERLEAVVEDWRLHDGLAGVAAAVVGLSVHHLQQVGILGQEVLKLIKGVVSVVGRSHPESFDAGGFDRDGKIETL